MKNIGLGLHFLLELAALASLVTWGLATGHTLPQKLLAGAVIPLAAAAAWGIFRVPNDPGPAVVAVPGPFRLALELVVLGGAAFALAAAGHRLLAVLFGAAIVVDYLLMGSRVAWLLTGR